MNNTNFQNCTPSQIVELINAVDLNDLESFDNEFEIFSPFSLDDLCDIQIDLLVASQFHPRKNVVFEFINNVLEILIIKTNIDAHDDKKLIASQLPFCVVNVVIENLDTDLTDPIFQIDDASHMSRYIKNMNRYENNVLKFFYYLVNTYVCDYSDLTFNENVIFKFQKYLTLCPKK